MAGCGASGACFLNAYAVWRATEGRIRADIPSYIKIGGSGLVAFGVGWLIRGSLKSAGPLMTIAGVSTTVLMSYGLCTWAVILASDERQRILTWFASTSIGRSLRMERR